MINFLYPYFIDLRTEASILEELFVPFNSFSLHLNIFIYLMPTYPTILYSNFQLRFIYNYENNIRASRLFNLQFLSRRIKNQYFLPSNRYL